MKALGRGAVRIWQVVGPPPSMAEPRPSSRSDLPSASKALALSFLGTALGSAVLSPHKELKIYLGLCRKRDTRGEKNMIEGDTRSEYTAGPRLKRHF